LDILVWFVIIEGLWLAGFPLSFQFLAGLPDRGFSFAPVVALLLGAYTVWLGASVGFSFQWLTWPLTLLLFAGLNAYLLWRKNGILRRQLIAFFRARWRLALTSQLVFWLSFAALLAMRYYLPDIRGHQEKFSDQAIYTALLYSQNMPPTDLWMAGQKVNYYYFSHFMMAYLTKLSGVAPGTVFNLFLASIFGLTATASFGLGYGLWPKRRSASGKAALITGLLAGLFMVVVGNLDAVRQLAAPGERDKGYCSGILENSQCFWWTPSRVIYELHPMPDGSPPFPTETVNEFPSFSFLLGDLHPHMVAFPFVLLSLALTLSLWRSPRPWLSRLNMGGAGFFALNALTLGGHYFLNTWNYPLALLLVAIGLGWQEWRGGRVRWGRLGLYLAALILVSLVLYAPFLLNFRSFSGQPNVPPGLDYPLLREFGKNIGVVTWERTGLRDHLLIFGLFDYCLIGLLTLKLWPYLGTSALSAVGLEKPPRRLWALWGLLAGLGLLGSSLLLFGLGLVRPVVSLGLGLLALPAIAGGGFLIGQRYLPKGHLRYKRLILLAGWMLLFLVGFALKTETLGLLLVALMSSGLLLWREGRLRRAGSGDSFCLMLIFLAASLLLALELFYLRDEFENRGNSIFKYYLPIWFLVGLASAYGVVRLGQVATKFATRHRVMWLFGLLLLISLSLFYSVLGPITRTNLFAEARGLDGEDWLKRDYPGDYAAIVWLRDQTTRNPAFRAPLIEAGGEDFSEAARISTFSGFPALIGWQGHEKLWRGYDAALQEETKRRLALTNLVYTSDDPAQVSQIIRSYGIRYVYVGEIERTLGANEGQLRKFGQFMRLIYDRNNVQIYAFEEG